MGAGFPISLVRADLRVSVICWGFKSAKALSLAMRYTYIYIYIYIYIYRIK